MNCWMFILLFLGLWLLFALIALAMHFTNGVMVIATVVIWIIALAVYTRSVSTRRA